MWGTSKGHRECALMVFMLSLKPMMMMTMIVMEMQTHYSWLSFIHPFDLTTHFDLCWQNP
jgi:hypothetical protein